VSIRVRVTLTLVAIGVALIGAYAMVSYRSEISDLRTSSRRELAIVGRALETSLANALRDRQRADVVTTLATLQAIAPTVDIHIYEPDGRLLARTQGAHDDAELSGMVQSAIDARKEVMTFDPDDDPTRLILTAPLVGPDGVLLGGLAIVSPTDELDADLQRTRRRLYAIVAVFLLVVTVAGMLLGTAYVTRPIRRVLAGVRGVRAGDFRSQVAAARHDEIGELVEEFNAMLRALAEARDRIAEETDAREHLERGLQRVDKMVTIGQLSAGLAHEIGSPLQVMAGRAAMLGDSKDPEVQRQARLLVEQCARITKIVEALLSFGRRAPAAFAPCDLAVPAKRVLELLEGEARRRQIALTFEAWRGGAVGMVSADADQMQQVVLNLVTNAMNATPSGGAISVSLAMVEGAVELRVRDTGKGIPSDSQTKLFEPFFTTRGTEGGSGLGLAVVHAIMVEHKGSVTVASEVGEGAEMICRFPTTGAGAST
jgi:signal transduction histidine kinase